MANLSQYGLDVLAENSSSSAQQDVLILSVIEQLKTKVINFTKLNMDNKSVNDTLTVGLERYKEKVKVLKEGQNVVVKSRDNFSDSHEQDAEIDRLKQTLSEQLQEKESLMKTVDVLKNDFKKEESRNIDREIALEKKIKHLDNIVYKRDQSAQTVHMLTKAKFFYDHSTKQALGFQNPFYLKKAQWLKPKLYDGNVIKNSCAIVIHDSEETLMLAEEIRSKMILKQQDLMVLEKKNSMNSSNPNLTKRPTTVEVPKELSKVSMAVEKHCLESKTFEVKMHQVLNENDRLSEQVINKDIVNIIVNSFMDNASTYKQLYDSIKSTRVQSKEQCDELINQVNLNYMEISNLNANLQEQGLIIAALRDKLKKLKGKAIVDTMVSTHTIDLEMLKVDVEPIAPRLLNNRTVHSDCLRLTQEQVAILRKVVEQRKS
uniref:Uncharacterized protein n=1 Tax=Tanacetum cinerariifolium TaxID=118510 RepID=A0A699KSA9_TANCI|nr:hypothetical protein [Tanacetum cinerariifolium]